MLERLDREVEAARGEMVTLAADLVRFPTINPPGEAYAPCAEFIAARMARSGFETRLIRAEGTPGDSDRYPRLNVVARREGGRSGPCVHFNGHIDVVEVGSGWTVEPFAGLVREGRLYGRGACDMKGGLAAAIVAAERFVALHPDHPGAIEVSGTVDEESGGHGGVAHLARIGLLARPRVDHVIIPEPLGHDRVCVGHRGAWWAEIETRGRIAHGSMPFLGDCAVRHMGAVVARMERDLWPALSKRRTAMPVVPEGAGAATLNINAVHGGEAEGHDGLPAPNVPHSCRMVLDRRFLIEERLEDVKGEVVALLDTLKAERPGFDYGLRDVMEILPTQTPEGAPVVAALDRAIGDVLGHAPAHIASPGTYDQKHFARLGHVEDCVAYGPGRLELAHQPDEFIGIDDMVTSAKVMARALAGLLGSV